MNNIEEKSNKNNLIKKYIEQLSNDEKIVLEIAKKQLNTSFSVEKSIGFLSWLKEK